MSTIEKTFNKTSDKTSAGDSSAGRVAVIKLKAIKISRNGDGQAQRAPFTGVAVLSTITGTEAVVHIKGSRLRLCNF